VDTFDVDLVAAPHDAADPELTPERIVAPGRGRRKHGSRTWVRWLMLGAGLAVAAGLVVVFLQFQEQLTPKDAQTGPADKFTGEITNLSNKKEKVFRIVVPRSMWKLDNNVRAGLKAVLALQRSDPEAWVALAAKDFGTRSPRAAELAKEGIERLKGHFGDTLELAEKADVDELAGERAQRLVFKGMTRQVFWNGVCYAFTHAGVGYWFFVAAPTLDNAEQTLADLQKERALSLVDERRGWSEQPPKLDTFGKKRTSLSAPEGVWTEFEASDVDERGDLLLTGRYLKEKDNRKNASVLIVALAKQPNLKEDLKAARTYFEDRKKEEDKDYRLIPVSDKADDPGVTATIGERQGRMLDLRVQLGNEIKRHLLLAVVDAGGQAFAIRCDCTWESRQIWRQDFLDLLQSFKLRK
jgi:hypothetical protein